MFRLQLHERTQRRVCRAGFILLCLLPTLGVSAWAVSVRLSSHPRAAAARLSHWLGLPATVERVTHPRPGTTTLESVVLTAANNGKRLASIEWIEMRQQGAAGYILSMHGVQIRAEGLPEMAAALLRATAGGDGATIGHVVVNRLTICPSEKEGGCEPFVLAELHARSGAGEGGGDGGNRRRCIRVKGRLADEKSKSVPSFIIRRPAPGAAGPTEIVFDTGGAAIPCWWLTAIAPHGTTLGPDATFRGAGRIAWQTDRSQGQVTGEMMHVDLQRATGSLPLGVLQATGTVTVEPFRWNCGRIEEARGAFRCTTGTIDGRLVNAAVRALACIRPETTTAALTTSPTDDIGFDELAFRFALDVNGLTLWGACESASQGTLLARSNRPLLTEPPYQRLPVANLVYLFVPQVRHYIPATREAQTIAGRLPLPSGAERK